MTKKLAITYTFLFLFVFTFALSFTLASKVEAVPPVQECCVIAYCPEPPYEPAMTGTMQYHGGYEVCMWSTPLDPCDMVFQCEESGP